MCKNVCEMRDGDKKFGIYFILSSLQHLQGSRVEFLDFMEQVCGFCEPYEEILNFLLFVHFSQFEPASLLWEGVFKLSYSPHSFEIPPLATRRAEQTSVPAANDLKADLKGLN